MPKDTRFQRYKEWIRSWAQCLRDGLVCLWTKSMAWVRRWGPVIFQAIWNGLRRAGELVRRHARLLGGIIVLIFFILSLWMLPVWQVTGAMLSDKERLELMDKIRGTLAQIWAGAGIALGLYLTWRRVAAAERTVQVVEEGQITERFTRAIDQLGATDEHGNKRLELRLGGIYALERIARDSEKDHWPIMEVLAAYVRENAPWKESVQPQQDQPPDPEALPAGNATQQQEPQARPTPDTDIQAILTVIGRRTRWFGKGEDQRLDLHGTDIRGANLRSAHLEGAFLNYAHSLTQEQVDSAHTDENTRLPDYLTSLQAIDEEDT